MPRLFSTLAAVAVLVVGTLLGTPVFAADVEVSFSSRIDRNMAAINRTEQKREAYFREFYDAYQSNRVASVKKFNVSRLQNVKWAGQSLIPNIADFTMENLTVALVSESLERAGMADLEGTIRLDIQRLKVSRYSVSALRGNDTFVIGTIAHLDNAGNVLKSVKISTNLVVDRSVDTKYQGPDFAFFTQDSATRVGPALARFIEKGLESLFEGKKFTGVVMIGS
ncbi:MAG: hypothetical protein IIA70_05325 [Proteobacteria bacterium]|nr:hypothetical protein [Pseudomonadota bacterium]